MATIEYESITQAIVDLLQNAIPECRVFMEPEEVGFSERPEIGVSLEGETNREETIGHSNPYHTILRFSLLCTEFSVDGSLAAIRKRHVLVNKVRDAIKADSNRNLGGLVEFTQLGDGEFETVGSGAGFFSAANIQLLVTIMA